jgi:hypothetical protein
MASVLILALIAASVVLGVAGVVGGILLGRGRSPGARTGFILAGALLALLTNSWWCVLLTIVFYKLFILGQDP